MGPNSSRSLRHSLISVQWGQDKFGIDSNNVMTAWQGDGISCHAPANPQARPLAIGKDAGVDGLLVISLWRGNSSHDFEKPPPLALTQANDRA